MKGFKEAILAGKYMNYFLDREDMGSITAKDNSLFKIACGFNPHNTGLTFGAPTFVIKRWCHLLQENNNSSD